MNIKNQKGFVGTDIAVAIILILIFMSVTSVLFLNLTKASKSVERESKAIYIATNVIETVKLKPYLDLETTVGEALVTKIGSNYSYNGKTNTVDLGSNIEIDTGYTCYITVENYVPEIHQNDSEKDYIKQVTVTVSYKIATETKSITLKTTILREV